MQYLIKILFKKTIICFSITIAINAHADVIITNEQPSLIFEKTIDNSTCSECPIFLNLTTAINKIIENVKIEEFTIAEDNELTIELNKLKYLQTIVKSEINTSEDNCQNLEIESEKSFERSDENIGLINDMYSTFPDFTDFQYIPKESKEFYYFHRDEDEANRMVTEVTINNSGINKIRYYDYLENDQKDEDSKLVTLPKKESANLIQSKSKKITFKKDGNFIDLNFDVKTKGNEKISDVHLIKSEMTTQVLDNYKLQLKNNVNLNAQSASISLQNDTGEKYVIIKGLSVRNGEKSLNTIIPLTLTLNKENAIKLKASLENQTTKEQSEDNRNSISNTQTVKMALTDHNHEYFNIEAMTDTTGLSGLKLSNKFSLVNESNIGATYVERRDGERSISIQNVANINKREKLTTSIGKTPVNSFAQTEYENKISERTSMVMTIKLDNQNKKSILYQIQSKF
jgi:hypothetical protein